MYIKDIVSGNFVNWSGLKVCYFMENGELRYFSVVYEFDN